MVITTEQFLCFVNEQAEHIKFLEKILEEVLSANGLGGTHKHFERYFYISEDLGKRIAEVLEIKSE